MINWIVELFNPTTGASYNRYHTGFTDLSYQSRSTPNITDARLYPSKEIADEVAEHLHSKVGVWKAVTHYGPFSYQQRVRDWAVKCFGVETASNRLIRGDRFLEEALELLQSGGYPMERIATLVDYVYRRPVGEPSQEVGGVMVTLAAYCAAHALDMSEAGNVELLRISKPEMIERIRAKQAQKARDMNFGPTP